MNDLVNYKKRKNTELFKSLERFDLVHTQNYIPIYTKLMLLNETNYNSINLNHRLYISHVVNNIDGNQNLYKCSLKLSEDDQLKSKPKNLFCKMAPLLDPIKYLIGKYDVTNDSLMNLPSINSTLSVNSKILDVNNSAYVDSFFSYLSSQLLNKHGFIHGIEFYGSFLSIKKNFKMNVYDDLDYLVKSDFFNKNKNTLFQIEDYSSFFDDESSKTNLRVIKIDATGEDCSFPIDLIEDTLFEEVFDISQDDNNNCTGALTIDNLKELSMETFSLNATSSRDSASMNSDSSCSSRTSHTRSSDISDGDEGSTEEWSDENSDDEDDASENECVNVTFPKYPVQVICMEQCQDTLDNLMLKTDMDEIRWMSALMQIIMTLITYQKVFGFTHNDLHTNNIMYVPTDKKFIYYCFKNKYYRVPTFGKIFKIIDFGRGIYKCGGQLFCSDSFSFGGDAATQYNIEPYFNDKKPRLEPNYSFDLCRLACSMFDYLADDMESVKDLSKCDTITRLIVEWCMDDNGLNVLYKNNGTDRYPDFKLYKMIARCVHKHTPQAQLERKEFNAFTFPKKQIPANEKVMNIDEYPSYM